MGYNKTTWVNDVSSLNATKMNNIETGIEETYKGTHIYGASSAGSDTYAISFTTAFASYNTGMVVNFKADVSNSGAATIDVDSLGAKDLKKMTAAGKAALATGDIIANGIYSAIYDGTDFILCNPLGIYASMFISAGDMFYASSANTPARLAIVNNKVLTSVAGTLAWTSVGAKGTYTDTTTSITAGSNYIASIALGCTPSKGRIILTNGNNQDNFAFVIFTTTESEARSINGIAGNDVEHGGFGGLSVTGSFGTSIRLRSAWIDGTNLKLEFECTSGTQTLKVNPSTWEVEM
jgi:hypothetical protein